MAGRGAEIRRAVLSAFDPAERRISQQEAEARSDIEQARQTLGLQKQQLSEQESSLSLPSRIRSADITGLARRGQVVSEISTARSQIGEQERAVSESERELARQVEQARSELQSQKQQEIKRLSEAKAGTILRDTEGKVLGIAEVDPFSGQLGERVVSPQGVDVGRVQGSSFFPFEVSSTTIPAQVISVAPQTSIVRGEPTTRIKSALAGVGEQARRIGEAAGLAIKAPLQEFSLGFFSQKPTALSGSELEEASIRARKPIVEAFRTPTFISKIAGREVAPATTISGKLGRVSTPAGFLTALPEAQIRGLIESRKVFESFSEARKISKQQQIDSANAQRIAQKLQSIEESRKELNKKIEQGNSAGGFSPEGLAEINRQNKQLGDRISTTLDEARKKDLIVNELSTSTGQTQLEITSPALRSDIRPADVKQLEEIRRRGGQVGLRSAGVLISRTAQAVTLGLAFGASGLGARIGASLGKPLSVGLGLGGLGLTGVQVARQVQVAKQAPSEIRKPLLAIRAGTPIVQTTGFVGGGLVGQRMFTQATLGALKRGDFTTAAKVAKRGTPFSEKQMLTVQLEEARTRIPGTRIKINQISRFRAFESTERGVGAENIPTGKAGAIITKVEGLGKTRKFLTDVYLFRKDQTTGFITATKVPKGTLTSSIRSTATDIVVDKESLGKLFGEQGSKSFFLKFKTGTELVGEPKIVKLTNPATRSAVDRLFITDVFQDAPVSGSKTVQIVLPISDRGAFKTFGVRKTIGTALGRRLIADSLKRGFVVFKESSRDLFLINKKGQILAIPKPVVQPATGSGLLTSRPADITKLIQPSAKLTGPTLGSLLARNITAQQAFFGTAASLGAAPLLNLSPLQQTTQQRQLLGLSPSSRALQTPVTTTTTVSAFGQVTSPAATQGFAQVTVQPTAQITPEPTPTPSGGLPTPRTPFFPGLITGDLTGRLRKALAKAQDQKAAFDVFIRRTGKYKKIADDLPLGKALEKGANVTKETLASQFKVVRDRKATASSSDVSFAPNPEFFRTYRISKGRRISLPQGPEVYEFIEKRRKRLATRGEVREIKYFQRQSNRRKRGGRIFGL